MPPDPKRVQAVFGAAIACEADADRAVVLNRECSTDPALRRRVEALLAAHDRPDNRLDRPIVRTEGKGVVTHSRAWNDEVSSQAEIGLLNPTTFGSRPNSTSTSAGGSSPESTRPAAPSIAGYEILEELGRGGMGVVYKARQIRLNRSCALKMILGGAHARPEAAARFLAEAQAIARLQHPNIVQIRAIGEADGLPFIELEYVDGGGVDKKLDGIPWSTRRAAGLVELLAGAVAEAHRLGIVHRDLKPANILLMADGTPKIADFGLAKSLGSDSELTATNSIMGSPSYMAPEQAAGGTKQLGPSADIYALGATLYELLTGRPPFRGSTILETLEQVKAVEPVPPSRLIPGLPRDIETIALKCLQKEPGKRYPSATALAEDLRRFLGGEPIVARPVPVLERAWRWCQRHPAPAGLTATVVLVSVLGLTGIFWQWGEAVKARDLASSRAIAEVSARRETETTLVDMYTITGITAGDQGENARAGLWFAYAARRSQADPDRRLANAVRARTWSRRAFTPLRAIVAEGSWPRGLVFHPDGRHLITTAVVDGKSWDARHLLWDLETERSLPFPGGLTSATAAAWSSDGQILAVSGSDGVLASRFPGGELSHRIHFPGRIRLLTFSPDGRFLAMAGGNSARVWDFRSRSFATPELIHPAAVTTLAFHPEGRFLATGCLDHLGRLFAVPGDATGSRWPPFPHRQEAGSAWFQTFASPPLFVDGGRGLITYGGTGGLTWRDVETGAEVRTLDSPQVSGQIASITLSPEGRHLAVSGFQSTRVVIVFDLATGRPIGPALDHQNTVSGAAFSPDGRMLVTGSTDNTVRLWSVPDGKLLACPLDLHRPLRLVAFTPGGHSIATQDGDMVRLWSLPGEALPMRRIPLVRGSSFAALSPDGTLAIPTGMTFGAETGLRTTGVFHVGICEPAGPSIRPGGQVVDAEFSPNGRSVVTLSTHEGTSPEGQETVSWDWAIGRPRWRAAMPAEPRSLAYRADGRRLAVLCGDGEVLVIDSESGRESLRWHAHDPEPAHHWINNGKLRFSPDGRNLLTWGMGNDVRIWEADTGRLLYSPLHHRDKCHDLQFSPVAGLMVLASYDGSVRVRDLPAGTVVAELPAHPDMVYSAGFSPDGRLVVTACRDRTVRVWDWRTGQLTCPPFEHPKEAVAAAFTPDGRWVLSASVDGTARVWDWRNGRPITPPLTIEGEPLSLAVTPDGKYAVVGGSLSALAVLDLAELARIDVDPDTLCLQAELLAGQRVHEGGGTVNLSADEWLDRWRAYRRSTAIDALHIPPH